MEYGKCLYYKYEDIAEKDKKKDPYGGLDDDDDDDDGWDFDTKKKTEQPKKTIE